MPRLSPPLPILLFTIAFAPPPSFAVSSPPQVVLTGSLVSIVEVTALPRLSTWKYNATNTDPGTAWRETVYDDAAWPSGAGPLGFGEPWIATTVPFGGDPSNRYPTTYFRTTFDVTASISSIQSLVMGANYDDGFVAYLNGAEVARRWLPVGEIVYDALASDPREGGDYETIDLTSAIEFLVQGTNVLAVELHQSAHTSPDLAWDADLRYSTDPMVTRGPYLQSGNATSITVRWRTTLATESRVRYGIAPFVLNHSFLDATLTTEHEVKLTGLNPATRYYYSVGTTALVLAGDPSYTFRTAPVPGTARPTRVWVVGDSGQPGADAYEVRDAYAAWTGSRGTDLWLTLGDNAYSAGFDSDYQSSVFDQYALLLRHTVLWPTRGNHDAIYAGSNNDYFDIFTMPATGEAGGISSGTEAYYAYDWSNIHFVCLDSQGSNRSPGSAMLTWLASDLAANSRPWVIAYWHHPPYSKGKHDSDDDLDSGGRMGDMRENVLPILEAAGVDLVLCGHSHSYERSLLLNGHYGPSATLTAGMIRNTGDGRVDGDGPYFKPSAVPSPNAGTVYAVMGSSSKTEAGPLNHPAMVFSLLEHGSMVLDIDGDRLDARFLSQTGVALDSFTIVKDALVGMGDGAGRTLGVRLGPGIPNPFRQALQMSYALERSSRVRLTLHDVSGRLVAIVEDGWREAGTHLARWDGSSKFGRTLPSGVYLAVLEADGVRVSRPIAYIR